MSLYYGEVLWFDARKGFGFLTYAIDNVTQEDMFVHFSDISCEGFKTLYKGQKVSFNLGTNKHGEPKAIDVTIVSNT